MCCVTRNKSSHGDGRVYEVISGALEDSDVPGSCEARLEVDLSFLE